MTFVLIALLGSAADLLSKHWVFKWRGFPGQSPEWWLVEPYFGIETSLNTGALFGMGAGFGKVFAILSVAAGVGILIWLFRFRAAASLWLTIALSLVMAGVLGNLYDRLGYWVVPGIDEKYHSAVRDWILLRWGDWTWPNFNLADSYLVVGACMLLIQAYREDSKSSESALPSTE